MSRDPFLAAGHPMTCNGGNPDPATHHDHEIILINRENGDMVCPECGRVQKGGAPMTGDFLAEMDRRIEEVEAGNYFEIVERRGLSYWREFRNGKPYGGLSIIAPLNEYRARRRRMHQLYRRRHR